MYWKARALSRASRDSPARLFSDTEGLGRWPRDTASPSETAASSDQPDAVTGSVEQFGRHLKGQPGLARPSGPGQRDQAAGLDQGPDFGHVSRPRPMNARQLGREIVRQRGVAERAQWREVTSQSRGFRAGRSAPGVPRSLSRWAPRSLSAAPGGSESRTKAAAVSDSRTCPPCAMAPTRAARCTSRPTRPAAVVRGLTAVDSPFAPAPAPHQATFGPPGRAACLSPPPRSAVGEENTAKNASPWVSTSLPSWAARAARISA